MATAVPTISRILGFAETPGERFGKWLLNRAPGHVPRVEGAFAWKVGLKENIQKSPYGKPSPFEIHGFSCYIQLFKNHGFIDPRGGEDNLDFFRRQHFFERFLKRAMKEIQVFGYVLIVSHFFKYSSWWLNQPIWKIGSFSQVGMKIKNIWNHQPGKCWLYVTTVDGRNPAPVEVGSLSHYLWVFNGFYTSQVVALGISEPSTAIKILVSGTGKTIVQFSCSTWTPQRCERIGHR